MPRGSVSTIDKIIEEAVSNIVTSLVEKFNATVDRTVSQLVRAEVGRAPRKGQGRNGRRAGVVEMTRWVADTRARRVPNFVKEMTGLDTKKKIVAKYGAGAAFEKGRPAPALAEKHAGEPKAEVKAKAPVVRKKAKSAA